MLVLPGQWRPTTAFDAFVEPVRGLTHPVTSRGAFKLYAGSAERDARVRFLSESKSLDAAGDGAFARITCARPLVLDRHDRFVLREAGRRETVAGGRVVDPHPSRAGADTSARLRALDDAAAADLPRVLLEWAPVHPAADLRSMAGALPEDGAVASGRGSCRKKRPTRRPDAVAGPWPRTTPSIRCAAGMEIDEVRAALAASSTPRSPIPRWRTRSWVISLRRAR